LISTIAHPSAKTFLLFLLLLKISPVAKSIKCREEEPYNPEDSRRVSLSKKSKPCLKKKLFNISMIYVYWGSPFLSMTLTIV